MEFKAGDRVHVLRYNGEDVDFYGTLKYVDKCMANLFDCTIKRNEGVAVFLPSDNSFGEDKEDYFVLEEDEEDTKRMIKGQKAGTALRTMFTNLSKPTKAMKDKMEELGISITDSNGEMIPMRDLMDQLREKKGGNNLPTIKRKVEMNLPQLIEWGIKNGITSKEYTCNNKNGYKSVIFSTTGTVHLNSFHTYLEDDKYEVEVKEKITEDTVFELMIEIIDGYQNCLWERASVNDWKDEDSKEFHAYIDGEFKLIWRDGKLVD